MRQQSRKDSNHLDGFEGSEAPGAAGKRSAVEGRYGASGGAHDPDATADQAAALLSGGGVGAGYGDPLAGLPRGGGDALDPAVAEGVASATGEELDDVRVHSDPASAEAAAALGARAFTLGSDIYMGEGEGGDAELLAHEAAHTLQQDGVAGAPQAKMAVSSPGDRLEVEADRVASAAVSGGTAPVSVGAGHGIQREGKGDVVAQVRDKMSYGVIDWAITNEEATASFDLLVGLEQPALRAALGRLGAKYFNRLLENLPGSVKARPAFARLLLAWSPETALAYKNHILLTGDFNHAADPIDAGRIYTFLANEPLGSILLVWFRLDAVNRAGLLAGMPRGAALSASMKETLDLLARITEDRELLGAMFEVRFAHPIQDGAAPPPDPAAPAGTPAPAAPVFTPAQIRLVWKQLRVLPESDVSGNQIWNAFKAIAGGGGFYIDSSHIELGVDGTDETRLNHTIRHEVGHGVHQQLQSTIDTWLQNDMQFWYTDWETWIEELGGFPSHYRYNGRKAFDDTAKQAVIDMVETFTGDGGWDPSRGDPAEGRTAKERAYWRAMPAAVKNACAESTSYWYSNWGSFQQTGGKYYFLNHWYHRPYRFGATAASAITASGDDYSAMSEMEFFANCYASYFEDPGGVTDASKWGGTLPESVKAFFASCIVGRNPYSKFQQDQAEEPAE